jgi:hypothetical protein
VFRATIKSRKGVVLTLVSRMLYVFAVITGFPDGPWKHWMPATAGVLAFVFAAAWLVNE